MPQIAWQMHTKTMTCPRHHLLPEEIILADVKDSKTGAGPAPVSETPTFRALC